MARLAQAASSEFYSAWGEPGNQRRTAAGDDGELNITTVPEGFTRLFRWKNRALAERAADLAIRVVLNPLVGYSQNNGAAPRTGLITELRSCHWVPENIKHKCNCDCSSFVMTICRYNDLDTVPEDMWTGNECEYLRATGAFTELPIEPKTAFLVGDILWRDGHTAIVIEGDAPQEAAPHKAVIIGGCSAAHVRTGAGTEHASIGIVHSGDVLPFYGWSNGGWAEVLFSGAHGFVSPLYASEIGLTAATCTAPNAAWLRSDAGTDAGKVIAIDGGETVYLTGECQKVASVWYRALFRGNVGWISGKYVRT